MSSSAPASLKRSKKQSRSRTGERSGAGTPSQKIMGRPPLYGAAMRARNVRLDDQTVAILRELGDGELSEGIRRAAEKLRKRA